MDKKSVDKGMLIASVILFLVMSASFLIMPLDLYNEKLQSSLINMISGLCFWIPLAAGSVMHVLLTKRRKQCGKNYKKDRHRSKRIGLVSFFENRLAVLADLVMIISFCVCAAVFIFTSGSSFFCYMIVALFVFSFCMHCILNGKNFQYAMEQTNSTDRQSEK